MNSPAQSADMNALLIMKKGKITTIKTPDPVQT